MQVPDLEESLPRRKGEPAEAATLSRRAYSDLVFVAMERVLRWRARAASGSRKKQSVCALLLQGLVKCHEAQACILGECGEVGVTPVFG